MGNVSSCAMEVVPNFCIECLLIDSYEGRDGSSRLGFLHPRFICLTHALKYLDELFLLVLKTIVKLEQDRESFTVITQLQTFLSKRDTNQFAHFNFGSLRVTMSSQPCNINTCRSILCTLFTNNHVD